MEPTTHTEPKPGIDITEQTYQGPGAAVTSLGYGFIDFKLATVASLILGIGAANIAPKQTRSLLGGMAIAADRWKTTGNFAQKAGGYALDGWVKSGNWFAEHIPFSKWLSKNLKHWEPIARTSGMLGVISFIGTTFSGTTRGINEARLGRDQFNTAKDLIKDLRIENEALRTRFTEHKLAADPELAIPTAQPEIAHNKRPQPDNVVDASSIEHTAPTTPAHERG